MAEQTEDPDAALVAAVAARDDTAFTVLYRRYLPVVLRWCLRETGNREIAADLSAEVFAAALISARRYRPEQGVGRRRGCSGSRATSCLRADDESAWRTPPGAGCALSPSALSDADLDRVEELASLDEEILALAEDLPAPLREALAATVCIQERSYEEIAEELRCSKSVVRQRVSRALRSLRSQMEER